MEEYLQHHGIKGQRWGVRRFQNEDGTYRSEFFDMIDGYERRLEYAKNNTSLPDHPNMKRVEEFVMSVNRRALDA